MLLAAGGSRVAAGRSRKSTSPAAVIASDAHSSGTARPARDDGVVPMKSWTADQLSRSLQAPGTPIGTLHRGLVAQGGCRQSVNSVAFRVFTAALQVYDKEVARLGLIRRCLELPVSGLSDPCREAWLTQRRAGDRWAHRGHCTVRAAGVRWAAAPVAVAAAVSAVGAAIPPDSVIGGRVRFGLLIRCLMRLGARPAASSRDGSWSGVAGSAGHGDMTIDSVAVTDVDELTPEGFGVFVQHARRWNGRPGRFHRRQVTSSEGGLR